MPAAVIPIGAFLRAEFVVLSVAPPMQPQIPFGILLIDEAQEQFEFRLLSDLDDLSLPPEDIDYLSLLDADFRKRTAELGGGAFLESLEDVLSGFLRLSGREPVSGRNMEQILDRLFHTHIDKRVRRFQSHLPLYGLRAAATKFGEDSAVDEYEAEWVRVPGKLRLSPDMFVVHVVGRSMEPLIPDGSLAIFRQIRPGSRQGKRLLIEEFGVMEHSARFTVKRYTSLKKVSESGEEWQHSMIRLEPLNPEFPAFELDPEAFEGRYRVIGEFVQVLPVDD